MNRKPLPMKLVFCDFETQSPVDLKDKVNGGSEKYCHHPYTRVMSGVFKCGSELIKWVPGQVFKGNLPGVDRSNGLPARILQLARTHTFVAHNAEMFDKLLIDCKYPNAIPNWIDSLPLCRAVGMPGALGKVANILTGKEKLSTDAMKLLCSAKMVGGRPVYPVGNATLWSKMLAYNVEDVELLVTIWTCLVKLGAESELPNLATHSKINEYGIKVDRNLVVTLLRLWVELQGDVVDEVAKMTDNALTERDLFSPIKVKKYLQSLGYNCQSLNKQMVDQILLNPHNFAMGDDAESILALLAIRKDAVRSVTGKLTRMLGDLDDNSIAKRSIVHYGAHTGRATGKGINPLNFPRGVDIEGIDEFTNGLTSLNQVSVCADKCTAKAREKNPNAVINKGDILATLTRLCIVPHSEPTLSIADYNVIEPRCVAWLANCNPLLDAFNDKTREVYCEMATSLFGRPITKADETERFIGKTIVLGCIAKDTPVLTNTGWKFIQDVNYSDKVWDGETFVECDGAIAKGRKLCYNVSGVWMTPDHKVLTDKGWVESCQLSENTHSQPKGWYSEDSRFNLLNSEFLQFASVGRIYGLQQDQSKTITVETFDILNAGPNKRFQAKDLIVHNCGYGMGGTRFEIMCKLYGVDIEKVGLTGKLCTDAYRKTYAEVKRLWGRYEDAAKNACECPGLEFATNRCTFTLNEIGWLQITLPSNRKLTYMDARVELVPAPWNENQIIKQVMYTTPHNYRKSLYGGSITENISQAVCRDLLYAKLPLINKVSLHVYDEIVAEHELASLVTIMSAPEPWSTGWTIAVAGFESARYTKSKFKGSRTANAINGVLQ